MYFAIIFGLFHGSGTAIGMCCAGAVVLLLGAWFVEGDDAQARGLDKDVQRAIIQNFNLAMLLVTFTTYAATGLITRATLPLLALVIPAMLLAGLNLFFG